MCCLSSLQACLSASQNLELQRMPSLVYKLDIQCGLWLLTIIQNKLIILEHFDFGNSHKWSG